MEAPLVPCDGASSQGLPSSLAAYPLSSLSDSQFSQGEAEGSFAVAYGEAGSPGLPGFQKAIPIFGQENKAIGADLGLQKEQLITQAFSFSYNLRFYHFPNLCIQTSPIKSNNLNLLPPSPVIL